MATSALAKLGWTTAGIDPGAKVAFQRHRELTAIPKTPIFSLVVLHHVLEHVTAPRGILRQLVGATLPGGFILISVPNLDDVGVHGDFSYCIRSRTHILAYTRECLRWLLASAGFRALDVAPDEPSGMRTIVLGRREADVPLPSSPLAAAVAAIAAYHARRPDAIKGPQWLPVRQRVWTAAAKKS